MALQAVEHASECLIAAMHERGEPLGLGFLIPGCRIRGRNHQRLEVRELEELSPGTGSFGVVLYDEDPTITHLMSPDGLFCVGLSQDRYTCLLQNLR